MKIKKKTIIEDVKRKTQFFRLNTFLNFGSDQKTFRWLLRRFVWLRPEGLKRTGVTAVRAIEQHLITLSCWSTLSVALWRQYNT